jgi:hypothetical protein
LRATSNSSLSSLFSYSFLTFMDAHISNVTLKRKIQKLYENKLDNEELLVALKDLGTFYSKNTLEDRWNLRENLEKRAFSEHERFLEAYAVVETELLKVTEQVSELQRCCNEMEKRLALTKSSSGTLLDQAEKLFHIKYVVEMKHERLRFCIKSLEVSRTMKCDPSLNISSYLNTIKTEVISNFLFRFQLTPEERKILTSSEISSHFFDVLNRVNQIRTDCKILLRTQHQRVGLEIMDLMADYLEAAYKKLYKWVRAECKLCLEKDCPEIPSLLRTAFHFLQDRPVLLAHCLEEIASQRQNALVRSFVMAVTQGGPSGTPRPIEMHAHDPQRYVSDMSAWIHQAVASEEELIRTLLSANKESTSQSNQENVLQVLNASLAGICHPFKMRVEHVLSMKPTVVVTYHLVNLLDFYSRRFKQMLGNNSILVKTFEEYVKFA